MVTLQGRLIDKPGVDNAIKPAEVTGARDVEHTVSPRFRRAVFAYVAASLLTSRPTLVDQPAVKTTLLEAL